MNVTPIVILSLIGASVIFIFLNYTPQKEIEITRIDDCNTNEQCILYFTHCSCSYKCGNNVLNKVDCEVNCPAESYLKPSDLQPECVCKQNKCVRNE